MGLDLALDGSNNRPDFFFSRGRKEQGKVKEKRVVVVGEKKKRREGVNLLRCGVRVGRWVVTFSCSKLRAALLVAASRYRRGTVK